ncbi:MAG: DUF2283 domain-containing protein [Candidatus Micrarchaeota archaeon]|nr:DUF2283 domain-containing protein [Candidatus Micrarchaeota archaeon]MDE1823913.1 DUF2283 domain-containing protein [Candidatus Micrarchaeota archaeon]MDE1849327.1 DUF2283 domain-containing protein [Candidatus Micrarchaeota archaeon]
MEISFDPQADIMYISIKRGKFSKTMKLGNETMLDYDHTSGILGLELIDVSNRMHAEDIFHIDIRMMPRAAD